MAVGNLHPRQRSKLQYRQALLMYFDELMGIPLHGTYWHDRFGYKHSHGCVNMPIKDTEWTFNCLAGAPNELWVWVHKSDPTSHLSD